MMWKTGAVWAGSISALMLSVACSKEEAHTEAHGDHADKPAAAGAEHAADAHGAAGGEHAAGAGHEVHWDYRGEGEPSRWGDLKPEYAACKTGQAQSPIDIPAETGVKAGNITLNYNNVALKLVNNGHTIQVNDPATNTADINGQQYELVQLHFHGPSEHTVAGKASDLELHLVHKNEAGQLAVIGLLLDKGTENPLVGQIWGNLPTEMNQEKEVAGIALDLKAALPSDLAYYHYQGSLTTPPCSEGVMWYVLQNHGTVSEAQIAQFNGIFQGDARPVQPLNGREVVRSK